MVPSVWRAPDAGLKRDPEKLQTFGQDHTTERILGAKSRFELASRSLYVFHGGCVLKRARRNFTSALMSASDSCEPNAGMERPSAPVGGLMPFRITSTTLSETGAWIEVCSASGTVAPLLR